MSRTKFIRDLQKGKKAEDLVVGLFKELTCQTEQSSSKFNDLSVNFPEGIFTFECKYDIMSAKTGNLAVEYFNSRTNQPSGIMVTTSDFWVFVLNENEIWITRTNSLKDYIDKNPPVRNLSNVGDGNACILLYKQEKLLTIFKRVDNIPKEELKEFILGK